MGRFRWGTFAVSLLPALIWAFAASPGVAGASFTLTGAGEHPAIAVDDSGTGHLAWSEAVDGGDDRLIYCRLPRGASACAETKSFTLPAENFNGPHVLAANGEVILVANHCCTLSSARGEIWALRSTDGGLSFDPATMVGDTSLGAGGVALGPGTGQISTVGAGTDGVLYQAEPLSGPTVPYTERALLLGGLAPAPISSVTMRDPLTPVVGYSDFDGHSFARIYGGSGSYNDAANWLPPTPPLDGDDAEVAGGPHGLYMIRRTGQPAKRKYVVDLYDPTLQSFAETKNVSPKGDPIFRDFIEDASGNLHAIWVQNDERREPLYLRQASEGRWQERRRLAKTNDDAFNLQVGAGFDGGGWAVWNTESGGGAVRAAPFAPLSGGGGACAPSVSYGKAIAVATEGCFAKNGNGYTTDGTIKLNGISLAPEGNVKIAIDKGKGTLISTGKVQITAANLELGTQKPAWDLPKHGGQLKDLAGNPAVFTPGKQVEVFRLPASGYVNPKLVDGGASELPVNLELPEPFSTLLGGKITGQTTLHLTQPGLILSGSELHADSIFLGIAEVRDLLLNYLDVGPFLLQGEATIVLPVVASKLETRFGLANGAFDYGNAILTFDDPGRPVSQFTYLRSIDFAVGTDPTSIAGGIVATAGPTLTLGGTPYAAATVNGTVSYAFTDPGVFTAEGSGQIFNVNAANVKAQFVTPDKLSLAGNFSIPTPAVTLSGSVDGDVSLTSGAFNLSGSGRGCGMDPIPGCVEGIKVLVSSKAAAGCAEAVGIDTPLGHTSVAAGVAYKWGSGFGVFPGCDLSPYKVSVSKAAARTARRGGAALGFDVPKRSKQVDIAVVGSGAPPLVTITGPGGETVSSAANPTGSATGSAGILTQSPEDATAYAALPNPARGRWTITPLAGSAPVTSVMQADSLPEPKIRARVTRAGGRRRVLHYSVKRIEGQVVRLFERGEFGSKLIGTARGANGMIRFSAADGPGGKRGIEADVQSFGVPRDSLRVASYRAPGPIKPAKPRRLRVRRAGGRALVSWRKAAGATSYVVEVALRDGRRIAVTTKRTKAAIRQVPGIDSARISVAGLRPDNSHGRVAHQRLRAKPKRRHRRGR